jgi:hypothetical protein
MWEANSSVISHRQPWLLLHWSRSQVRQNETASRRKPEKVSQREAWVLVLVERGGVYGVEGPDEAEHAQQDPPQKLSPVPSVDIRSSTSASAVDAAVIALSAVSWDAPRPVAGADGSLPPFFE